MGCYSTYNDIFDRRLKVISCWKIKFFDAKLFVLFYGTPVFLTKIDDTTDLRGENHESVRCNVETLESSIERIK
jgi:hypothetical protein